MELEEFAQTVLTIVRDKADKDFCPDIITNMKNNGIKLTGISATTTDSNARPIVYLDGYYEQYQKQCMEIEEAANAVYLQLMEHRNDLCDTDLNNILQWNVIRYNICAKLINAEMNKELLKMIPHRLFMDLAVVYYISMNDIIGESGGIASILIHHNHMELWGQKEEDLYQVAIVNMRSEGNPLFEDISEVIKHMAPEFMDIMNNKIKAFGMYVLTNRHETFGASELLDKSTLKGIGEQLEDDFIVLPSSIHETIIIPSDNAPEFSELAVMVKRINKEQVDAQECLSDHVYMYDREKDKLEIVA